MYKRQHQNRGIKGLPNGKRQCQPIWDEFFHNKEAVIFKSEQALAHKENRVLEAKFKQSLFETKNLKGMSKIIAVKSRVNQYVFRQMVLANYASQCAITGIDIPELLVASHIIPWAKSEKERLNPENGICLSPMFDKAFDKGLIGIDDRYRVVFSKDLKQNSKQKYFGKHFASAEKTTISKPEKYQPKKEFLQFHMETIFRG